MLSFPANVRVFLCTQPTDLRKGFDGLHALASQVFQRDPLEGHLFLFLNRRRDRIKLLYWDRDGLAVWAKRLELGTYQIPSSPAESRGMELDATQLALLLTGIDLKSAQRRKRYSHAA
jgi:transposase